jgi:chromosomal replication initiator protein
VNATVWQKCLSNLEEELSSQQFSTWIRPLQAETRADEVRLLAPNRYIRDQIEEHFFERIRELVEANGFRRVSIQIVSFE